MSGVVVVGGGLAGLTAARELARAGAAVTLVEADARLGGRLGADAPTVVRSPAGREHVFPDEHGLHAIWRQYWNVRRQLAELRLEHRLVAPGTQELWFPDPGGALRAVDIGESVRGSRLPTPLAVMRPWADPALLRRVAAGGVGPLRAMAPALRLALDPTAGDPALDRRTIADLVAGWPPECAHLFASLAHAAFFDEPARVSLAALALGLRFYFVEHREDSGFHLLDGDADSVWLRPLAADLARRGAVVRCGVRALGVAVADGRATGVVVEDAAGRRTLPADGVVIALDPGAAHRFGAGGPLAVPAPPPGLPSTVVRRWTLRRPSPARAASGMMSGLDATAFFWLERAAKPARAWAEETGGGVLELHLYGDAARWPADEAARRAEALALRLWPEAGPSVHHTVRRNPATQVAFPPGAVGALPPRETPLPNVVRCGDGVALAWPALFLERACATAVEASRTLAAMLGLAEVPPALRLEPPAPSVRAVRRMAALVGAA